MALPSSPSTSAIPVTASSSSQPSKAPQWMQSGSQEDSREARQRLQRERHSNRTSRLFSFKTKSNLSSLRTRKDGKDGRKLPPEEEIEEPEISTLLATGAATVNLDDAGANKECENADVYRWAILYENQRGTMIFSTPYYSSLSLLPNDPPPFTVPSTLPSTSNSKPIRKSKDNQPNVSLEDYPLPDGNWRWVSKTWMVDMQDDGSVQHDGFEYNWFFRSKNWRAKVGTLGAGGWVRRRRWLRLMMRPALGSSGEHDGASEWGTRDEVRTIPDRGSEAGSSVVSAHGKDDIVWRGDDGDWARCHYVLKRLERDGRKLELWKMWIGTGTEKTKAKDKQRQWTEDEGPLPSELASALDVPSRAPMSSLRPDLDHVAAVLGSHGMEILNLFIYPASRVDFIQLVSDAGLQDALRDGIQPSTSLVEFWSQGGGFKDDEKQI